MLTQENQEPITVKAEEVDKLPIGTKFIIEGTTGIKTKTADIAAFATSDSVTTLARSEFDNRAEKRRREKANKKQFDRKRALQMDENRRLSAKVTIGQLEQLQTSINGNFQNIYQHLRTTIVTSVVLRELAVEKGMIPEELEKREKAVWDRLFNPPT